MNPSKAALRIEARFPAPGDYRIHLCDQCGLCAEVCPVEAIRQDNGVYVIEEDECTACMTCVEECPHGVLFEHKSSEIPFKCTLCGECVKLCPREALIVEDNQKWENA
jgi:ferredoxin